MTEFKRDVVPVSVNTNEPTNMWQFESYSEDNEVQFLELVKAVADIIEYRVHQSRNLKHIKQYAIMCFNDIGTDAME